MRHVIGHPSHPIITPFVWKLGPSDPCSARGLRR
jgi:hypothetical protein